MAPGGKAPETPRKRGGRDFIDDRVQQLRNELDLNIPPRNPIYSPTQHNIYPGDRIYDNVKLLHWKDPETLHAVIEGCKSDFKGPSNHAFSSSERRTQHVSKELEEAAASIRNRIRLSLDRPNTPSTTRTPPRSQHWLRSLHRSDSKTDLDRPSTPTSPLGKKSMANTQKTTPATTRGSPRSSGDPFISNNTTAVTSFASEPNVDEGFYGSSWGPSQDPRNIISTGRTQTFKADLDKRLEQPTTKRKRVDETESSPKTPTKRIRKNAQENEPSDASPSARGWRAKRLVSDGLGNEPLADFVGFWNGAFADKRSTTLSCVLTGVITFNKTREEPLVKTKMRPVRWEKTSSRSQRHFGSHRFFVLAVPCFIKGLRSHVGGSEEDRLAIFNDWLTTPKHSLGREWWIFHVEDIDPDKVAKSKKNTNEDLVPVRYVSLFATKGFGISQEVSIFEFLDWMFPFTANLGQPVCKAYARLPLSTKQSTPSICFKPSQIRWVEDIRANGESENTEFEDPVFRDRMRKDWDKDEVMTDGCATISVGAALKMRESGAICGWPSAIQGRINGAKGMWCISAPYETSDPDHLAIWIEIRPSQLKIKPREEDMDDLRCDEDRWMFDVKDYSKSPKTSHLHKDFLPVLEDRHVPSEVLLGMIRERVDPPITELKEMLNDPAKLVFWRSKCFPAQDEHLNFERPGIPRESSQRASLFVDRMGYMPQDNLLVAEAFERMIEFYLQRVRSQFRFACLKSALLLGLPDHKGVLKPGEVHLVLSQPLKIDATEEQFYMFAGNDVLVARDPTIRGSDMQKVRCICHPELAHLKDVVIFPTRGRIPLAAKLQGGDYDGDRFWVCAEESLVAPFLNAPVLEQAGIDFFGIEQEKRKLEDIVNPKDFGTDEHAKAFLRIVLPIACRDQQKLLGTVTNYCNDLTYARHKGHGLWDTDVLMIADLHDLIIDAEKNGYLYSLIEFRNFCSEHGLPVSLEKRLYDANIKAVKLRGDSEHDEKSSLLTILAKRAKHKHSHILDRILFEEVNPPFCAYLKQFQRDVVKPAEDLISDADLEFGLGVIEADPGLKHFINLEAEKQALVQPLQETLDKWRLFWVSERGCNEDALLQCIEYYNGIKPAYPENPYWSMPQIASSLPSNWDCFKLAVFVRKHYGWKRKAIFSIARDVVCKVKSQSENGRQVLEAIRGILKPTKPKARANVIDQLPTALSEEVEFDFEDGFGDDLFDVIG